MLYGYEDMLIKLMIIMLVDGDGGLDDDVIYKLYLR